MLGDGGGRSEQRQAELPSGAEAAFAGLERGGTAAPVSPPHTKGATRLQAVKRRGARARVSAQAHLSPSRARSQGRAPVVPVLPLTSGAGSADSPRASEGGWVPAGLFIQTELFCYCEERHCSEL